jgi:hypothetical protein
LLSLQQLISAIQRPKCWPSAAMVTWPGAKMDKAIDEIISSMKQMKWGVIKTQVRESRFLHWSFKFFFAFFLFSCFQPWRKTQTTKRVSCSSCCF